MCLGRMAKRPELIAVRLTVPARVPSVARTAIDYWHTKVPVGVQGAVQANSIARRASVRSTDMVVQSHFSMMTGEMMACLGRVLAELGRCVGSAGSGGKHGGNALGLKCRVCQV